MIKPYKISVPKSTLNNIYKKVRSYPWEMMQNVNGWEYGTNYNFLNKFSILDPSLNIPFVYFPMNITEEASLLHYAPFFTNQTELIRNISKSLSL